MLAQNIALVNKLQALISCCERTEAMSRAIAGIRERMVRYMADVQQCITEQEKLRAEFVEKKKSLEKQCKDTEYQCKILRGDEALMNSLSPEEVTKQVDFVMEAIGQLAVAKYLTKQ